MFPIFEKLGGQEAALKAIRPAGAQGDWPRYWTLKHWRFKSRKLPPDVIDALMAVCDARGIPYERKDFYLPAKEPADTSASA